MWCRLPGVAGRAHCCVMCAWCAVFGVGCCVLGVVWCAWCGVLCFVLCGCLVCCGVAGVASRSTTMLYEDRHCGVIVDCA